MANCKRCDRCGGYYEECDNFKVNIPNSSFLKVPIGCKISFGKFDIQATNGSWVGPIDLCKKCGESLYNWFTNEEENDGEQGTEKTKKKT